MDALNLHLKRDGTSYVHLTSRNSTFWDKKLKIVAGLLNHSFNECRKPV